MERKERSGLVCNNQDLLRVSAWSFWSQTCSLSFVDSPQQWFYTDLTVLRPFGILIGQARLAHTRLFLYNRAMAAGLHQVK